MSVTIYIDISIVDGDSSVSVISATDCSTESTIIRYGDISSVDGDSSATISSAADCGAK